MNSEHQPLLKVENLSVGFRMPDGEVAVTDSVSFEIRQSEIYGLVGESGCGKSVTCLALLRMLPVGAGRILSGRVEFEGRDLLQMSMEEMRKIRGSRISMIFQEPSAALNPLIPIRRQLLEGFEYHPHTVDPMDRIHFLLKRVGFPDPDRVLKSYPHELSGGMLQRVMICLALLHQPRLILADEPTTALDVTIQAQIMELLKELQSESGMSLLMVTHHLALVAQYADRLGVMYAGRMVEEAPVEDFFQEPRHPYSMGLLAALPDIAAVGRELRTIPGQVPRPDKFVSGCRFHDRCPHVFEACKNFPPEIREGERKIHCFLRDPDICRQWGKGSVQVSKKDYPVCLTLNEAEGGR